MEHTVLTLDNWGYNAVCILEELERITFSHGGEIVSTWKRQNRKTYLVTNRRLDEAIHEKVYYVDRLRQIDHPDYEKELVELERLKSIDNHPRELHYGEWLYIAFVLDGIYYYYQLNDNCFFDFLYSKIAVCDGRIASNTYCRTDHKKWLTDICFSYLCTDEDRSVAAQQIFDMLMRSSFSKRYSDEDGRSKKLYVVA